ncbi:PTS transporter subunit EIIC [Bailinhaonella thermotolerans]|uniref:PTS sugar transporter subunit IIA n=1 Tax=Bailinhaonella thermotolerans TaxID=1070861 RepID=A0A3A4AN77_9ACTN|nr:PTS transporter subunit EIIC [Bailinhaonella thermotolerans]RJL30451.1 PTS sugar transporter subunit IIA [Bailinhaonella thermotolerans]
MSSTAGAGAAGPPLPRSAVMAVLQRIGRSLMLPIAVLPAGGLLLRFGQDDLLGRTDAVWLDRIAEVLAAAGGAIFDNLPLLFAVGVAIGFARKADGSTALAAVVGYLVFHAVSMRMFQHSSSLHDSVVQKVVDPAAPGGYKEVLNLGMQNPTRVLGGILIGLVAALLWQKYYRIKLPSWLAFFGGRRFVPIVTAVTALLLGVLFGFVWPILGGWLDSFGDWLTDHGTAGTGIYGVVNRLLLPLGLHHIVNSIVWFTLPDCRVGDKTAAGDLNCYFLGEQGAGTFMAGFFPILMFALPAAALAMWRAAPPERRPAVGGIMISAALTAFLTGITEPIEFAFIFVAPVLLVVHAILTGAAMAIASALDFKLGFNFSAGLVDYVLNFSKDNTHNPWLGVILGLIFAAIYYVLFLGLIKKMNIMTPGREPVTEDLAVGEGAPPSSPAAAEKGSRRRRPPGDS